MNSVVIFGSGGQPVEAGLHLKIIFRSKWLKGPLTAEDFSVVRQESQQ